MFAGLGLLYTRGCTAVLGRGADPPSEDSLWFTLPDRGGSQGLFLSARPLAAIALFSDAQRATTSVGPAERHGLQRGWHRGGLDGHQTPTQSAAPRAWIQALQLQPLHSLKS